ncbi:MAG TPA: MFS transporter [Mycobacteriales bacterium]|nr:MFS transporter [Mycobacteriales bacterium]
MGDVTYRSTAGRGLLVATVLGSGVAFLDSTVVNVALPRMAASLHSGFATMQWVLDAYLLTLGSLVLIGGALGDVIGRRRVFLIGLVGFGATSALCGASPDGRVLIVSRAVQGIAAALLVPGSLSLITASYTAEDRDRAIGAWSGLAGLASALGPFLGGWLVGAASWRWVFFINLPLIAVAIAVTLRCVPESRDEEPGLSTLSRLDLPGAVLASGGLALLTFPLIENDAAMAVRGSLFAAAAIAGVLFVVAEHRRAHPMLPLELFGSRTFTIANAVTFVVYGALGGALFLVAVQLQTGLGYSPLEAGAATVPITVLLLLFSARVGALLPRVGARTFLTAGPILAGGGLVLLARAVPGSSYAGGVLPGVLVFAAGMCLVVAPITATALGAVEPARAGLASGVNNAVARVAGLVAVAVLPVVAGAPSGTHLSTHGYRLAMIVAGVMAAAGGVLALAGLPVRSHVTAGAREPDPALQPPPYSRAGKAGQ